MNQIRSVQYNGGHRFLQRARKARNIAHIRFAYYIHDAHVDVRIIHKESTSEGMTTDSTLVESWYP